MKKTLSVIILALAMAMLLVGCGKVKCVECGEKKAGKTREIFGVDVDVCNDCWDEYQDAMDDLDNAIDDLNDSIDDLDFGY